MKKNSSVLKSVVSMLMVVMLAFQFNIPVFAENTAVIDEENVLESEGFNLLKQLEIITPFDDGTYKLKEALTRADLAVYTVRLLGLNDAEVTTNTYFEDVPSYHWAASSVEKLLQRGIISKSDYYRPDESATIMEVCKVMAAAAGYTPLAEVEGGYPFGYYSVANKAGIINKNIDDLSAPCLRADAFELFFNTLTVNIVRQNGVFNGSTDEYEISDDTLLSQYRNIYIAEGRINGVHGISFNDMGKPGKDKVILGDRIMNSEAVANEEDFLGHTVRCYYYNTDKSENEIIYLHKTDDSVTINADDIISYDDYQLNYYNEQGKEKTLDINHSAVIVKNGKIVSNGIDAAFEIPYGTVTLIGKDGYDVVIIRQVESLVCGSVDSYNDKIYIKDDPSRPISIGDDGNRVVNIRYDSGIQLDVSQLESGMLLSVVRSENDEYVDIMVSTVSQNIKIDSVENESDYIIIKSSDEEYRLLPEVYRKNESSIKPGAEMLAKMNIFGVIADLEKADSIDSVVWGYAIKSAKPLNIAETFKIELYNSKRELLVLELANKLTFDGVRKSLNSTADVEEISNTLSAPQVIVYKTNENGQVNYIDTCKVGSNETTASLTRVLQWGTYSFDPWLLFRPNHFVSADTVVISVPDEDKLSDITEADLSLQSITDAITWQWVKDYECEAYKLNSEDFFIDIVVLRAGTDPKYDINYMYNNMFIVDSMMDTVDEDGVYCKKISTIDSSGSKVVYKLEDEAEFKDRRAETGYRDIEKGDCVLAKFEYGNVISGFEIIYDLSEKQWLGTLNESAPPRRGDEYADQRISMGYVSEIYDKFATWSYTVGGPVSEAGEVFSIKINVVNNKRSEPYIYSGDMSVLKSYKDAGADCSKIIVQARQGRPVSIIVYQD